MSTGAQTLPQVAQVLHPSLPSSPGHTHWRSLCRQGISGGAAGLFSLVFHAQYASAQVDAFCDALRCFRLGYSWGGPYSLVVPYDLSTMREAWPAHVARGTLVRFSVGLEDVEDLRQDIAQALGSLT